MPVIKAFDLAYGRLRSPDLDKQEEFLTDFGMVRADRTKNALYMRGTDAPHHIHVTELGEPGLRRDEGDRVEAARKQKHPPPTKAKSAHSTIEHSSLQC